MVSPPLFGRASMTDFIPFDDIDPHRLDLSGPVLRQAGAPSFRVAEGREPRLFRIRELPCLGMAAALHGLIVIFGLSVAVSTQPYSPVVSIALLPGVAVSGQPAGGDGESGPVASATVPETVAPKAAEAVAAKVDPAEVRPAKLAPKKAVRVARKDVAAAVKEPAPERPAESSPAVKSADEAQGDISSSPAAPAVETASGPASDGGRLGGGTGGNGPAGSEGSGGGGGPAEARFGDADGPRFVQRVMPKYPELARRRGREGLVVLRLSIDADGVLRDILVVEKAGFGLDEAALEAARASTYAPATRSGRAVDCVALLPVRFALKEG